MHRSLASSSALRRATRSHVRPSLLATPTNSSAAFVGGAAGGQKQLRATFKSNAHQDNVLAFTKSDTVDEQGKPLSDSLHDNREYLVHKKNEVRFLPVRLFEDSGRSRRAATRRRTK
jgi:hypothetical protein